MSFPVKIAQWPDEIAVDEDRTILEAALDHGIPYPHGCRSGNCGACKSRLYAGRVEMEPYSEFALAPEEVEEGFVLACRAKPRSAVEIAWQADDAEAVAHPLRRFEATVEAVEPLTHDTRLVRLAIPDGREFEFSAGQYASLTFAGQPPRDYSMANAPEAWGRTLEFHIRAMTGGRTSRYVLSDLAIGDKVRVEGPFGSSYLREQHRGPIVAIAGGSGLAPVKSIVETALAKGLPQPIYLYFGVRDERDVYLADALEALAARHPQLHVAIVLSEPSGPTARRTGLVTDAVASDFDDLDGCKAYLAGPPVMVEAAVEMLRIRDMRPEDIHADAFYTEAEKAAQGG